MRHISEILDEVMGDLANKVMSPADALEQKLTDELKLSVSVHESGGQFGVFVDIGDGLAGRTKSRGVRIHSSHFAVRRASKTLRDWGYTPVGNTDEARNTTHMWWPPKD